VAETVTIASHFRGPAQSAQGGYACGLLARQVTAPVAEVTLRSPPPLDTELQVRQGEAGAVQLLDDETLVAAARPAESPRLELPVPVSLEQAQAARDTSFLQERSPYPGCFVCGPDRPPGDGLRVIAGAVDGRDDVLASPWEVESSVPVEDGNVASEIVWAVLDCPSGCSLMLKPDVGVCMMGRMRAEIYSPVFTGQNYVAVGWPTGREGRKIEAASAILTPEGEPVAVAESLWIELKDQP